MSRVLAHLAAPTGAGKTWLLDALARQLPWIVPIELDAIDEEACRLLGWERAWRATHWGPQRAAYFQSVRQRLFDRRVWAYPWARLVVAGFHREGMIEYRFDALLRIRIAVPPLLAAFRRHRRDAGAIPRSRAELAAAEAESTAIVQQLDRAGYVAVAAGDVCGILQATAAKSGVEFATCGEL